MQVKPKLSLNNSPTNCEEGSLVFAKNVKVDTDGSIVPDYGYDAITVVNYIDKGKIVGHIVGLDNTIYFFFANNGIVEYNELNKTAKAIACAWKYEDGAEIDGCVTTNVSGEKILTVAQYKEGGNIPLQHINLKYCTTADDTSVYNQAPNIPIVNLILNTTYAKTIPNGVYVFYIRWEIRDKVYTPWMLCSHPVFAGVNTRIDTIQGGVKYVDTKKDSAKSFIFDLNVLDNTVARLATYKKFQLGFVLTHDDATVARSWKIFKVTDTLKNTHTCPIYFDYENVDEVNIDDMQMSIYELYNVRNVANFKNKLYISNYKESDFNDKDNLDILKNAIDGFDSPRYDKGVSNDNSITTKYGDSVLNFNYTNGYFDTYDNNQPISQLFAHAGGYYNAGLKWGITKAVKTGTTEFEKAVTFDVCWDANINPDLATVCNINNNIEGFAPFGSLPEGLRTNNADPTRFMKLLDTAKGLWIYGPYLDNTEFDKNHPWYKLSLKKREHYYNIVPLTFIYGSTESQDINTIPGARYHVFPFNVNTHTYSVAGEDDPSKRGWPSRDKGIDEAARSYIKRNVIDEVEGQKYCAIAYMYFTNGATKYYVNFKSNKDNKNYCIDGFSFYSIGDWNGDILLDDTCIDNIDYIKTQLYKYVYYNYLYTNDNNIVGLDENGMLIIKVTNPDTNETINIPVNTVNVVFKCYEFSTSSPDEVGANDDNNFNVRFDVKLKTTTYEVPITFAPLRTITNNSSLNNDNIQSATLMPYSKYNYYAHLVKANGMITNGIKLGDYTNDGVDSNKLITPNFILGDVSKISNDYVGWFVSIENIGKKIAECFNIIYANGNNYASCLEVDAMLYNLNNNIKIIDSTGNSVTDKARYASCGVSNPIEAFGNCGFVYWNDGKNHSGEHLYIEIDNDESDKDVHDLIKCTPYYPLVAGNYDVHGANLFTGSYLCYVKKPTYRLGLNTYVAGKDVYKVNRNNGLSLTDFGSYIQMQSSNTVTIHSNFNLNYLSLTTDIEDQVFTIGSASTGYKQVAKVINSAQLSFIYELKSMYKDFTNQVFRSYTEYSRTQFDNTIRVSNVLSDETFNNSVYTFAPNDYYNIPTNRGIIVKLIAISTYIYVHTTGALYRFDGSETITSNDKTIQLKESEPFVNGITAVLDSQYGYAGLTDKHSAVATFSDYYFYDSVSNHIFGFAGQGGIKIIDTSIWELLKHYKPTSCNVISDEINNRIMFDFSWKGDEGSHNFCISYNTLTNAFVSLHDLSLNNAFNSRRNCYSYKNNLVSLFGGNTEMIKHYGDDVKADCYIKDWCSTSERTDTGYIVDVVLFPDSGVNVINNVHYIARLSTPFNNMPRNYIRPTGYSRANPVKNLYVWSDSAESNVINSNNDANVLNSYKGFSYDKGQWTVNYLRNILNSDNIYKYPDNYQVSKKDNNGHVEEVHRHLISDQNSLVYGRYFVVSLMFTFAPFKLESVDINKEIY